MQILKINPNIINQYKFTFKSQETDNNILGYDDSISKQYRNFIREWREAYYTPYQSLYEKECNLPEYQMKQLLGKLMKKPKIVNYEMVTGIEAFNVCVIDDKNSCYRGSTLMQNPKALETLKKAGIERVIDLVGFHKYAKRVKEAGLEYYVPEFGRCQMGVWSEEAFDTKEALLARQTRYYNPIDFEKNKKYLETISKDFACAARNSVERFVKFIEVLQKGFYYIGCEYGTYKTDEFMLLNTVFNPKAESDFIPCKELFKVNYMINLYNNLSSEHKQRMGWTQDFGERVLKRLKAKQKDIINCTLSR